VILITGATGAIGLAMARQLAVIPSAEAVLACRNAVRLADQRITVNACHSGGVNLRIGQSPAGLGGGG